MSIIKSASKILSKFDFTGESIPIHIDGKHKITSTPGGLLGMLIYGLLGWFI